MASETTLRVLGFADLAQAHNLIAGSEDETLDVHAADHAEFYVTRLGNGAYRAPLPRLIERGQETDADMVVELLTHFDVSDDTIYDNIGRPSIELLEDIHEELCERGNLAIQADDLPGYNVARIQGYRDVKLHPMAVRKGARVRVLNVKVEQRQPRAARQLNAPQGAFGRDQRSAGFGASLGESISQKFDRREREKLQRIAAHARRSG